MSVERPSTDVAAGGHDEAAAMMWRSEAPSSIAQPARLTSAAVGLWISNHSPSLSPTAAGLRMISLITSSPVAAAAARTSWRRRGSRSRRRRSDRPTRTSWRRGRCRRRRSRGDRSAVGDREAALPRSSRHDRRPHPVVDLSTTRPALVVERNAGAVDVVGLDAAVGAGSPLEASTADRRAPRRGSRSCGSCSRRRRSSSR